MHDFSSYYTKRRFNKKKKNGFRYHSDEPFILTSYKVDGLVGVHVQISLANALLNGIVLVHGVITKFGARLPIVVRLEGQFLRSIESEARRLAQLKIGKPLIYSLLTH